jgi:hypothetical protein
VACGLLAAASLTGCGGREGDGLPRQAVSGRVTLDEAPLTKGQIVFSPASGGAGTQVGGAIADGSYRIEKEQGPVPGRYDVMITAGSTAEGDPDDPAKKVKITPEPIPQRYNARTTLQVEVQADRSNSFDFPVSSK